MSERELVAFKTRMAKDYPSYWELADYVLILEQERNNYKELYEKENKNQKDFVKFLEEEKNRLARECSQIYEDSLGKTKLVNEDIFNEVNVILSKYKDLERL